MSASDALGILVVFAIVGVLTWFWARFLIDHDVVYHPDVKSDPRKRRQALMWTTVMVVFFAALGIAAVIGSSSALR